MVWRLCKNPRSLVIGQLNLSIIWATLILKTISSRYLTMSLVQFGHEIMKYLCQQSDKCITQLWRNQKQSAWSQWLACLIHPADSYLRTMIAGRIVELEELGSRERVTGCNLGRGKYNADFRNNSLALAKRFSINDAVQCCKVVLETRFVLNQMPSFCLYDKSRVSVLYL